MKKLFFLIIFIITLNQPALAEKFASHFSSIKSSEVNVRRGPNIRYQIDWVFVKKGEPVEVIGEFEHWNRIRDINGDEGWVKSIMLSKKRTAIIVIPDSQKNNQYGKLRHKPHNSSNVFAKIAKLKRVSIEQCQKEWCKIRVNNISGWIEKDHLWGVYQNEIFK